MPPRSKWHPKSNIKVNVLNLSDKVKILDVLKRQHVFSGFPQCCSPWNHIRGTRVYCSCRFLFKKLAVLKEGIIERKIRDTKTIALNSPRIFYF
jgi:hypothetical protein